MAITNLNFQASADNRYRATYTTTSDHDVLQMIVPNNYGFVVYARIPETGKQNVIYGHSKYDTKNFIAVLNVPTGIELVIECMAPVTDAVIMGGQ